MQELIWPSGKSEIGCTQPGRRWRLVMAETEQTIMQDSPRCSSKPRPNSVDPGLLHVFSLAAGEVAKNESAGESPGQDCQCSGWRCRTAGLARSDPRAQPLVEAIIEVQGQHKVCHHSKLTGLRLCLQLARANAKLGIMRCPQGSLGLGKSHARHHTSFDRNRSPFQGSQNRLDLD